VAHQIFSDDAHKWEQTIWGIFESPVGVSAGETFERELVGLQLRS
jgi:hypothetical protein